MLESQKRKSTNKVLEMLRKAGTPSAVQYQGAPGSGGIEESMDLFDPEAEDLESAVDTMDPEAVARKKKRKLATPPAY